jgi:hypothetical protein
LVPVLLAHRDVGRRKRTLKVRDYRMGRQDEFPSVLFLSSRSAVALRFEYLPGLDGAACRTPFLLGTRSS